MSDDAQLLDRYAASPSDESAFAELVRRHVDAVYSAALRRVGGDTHLAEDVTQQVFSALARRAATLVNHPHLTGWLYLTTRNEAANTVRAERRRKAREQEASTMQESASSPSDHHDWDRIAPGIDEAIDHLNERDRAVILLRFIENRPFAEIGAALNLTEDAARMRVERALDKLRASLTGRGVASTSAALGLALTQHAVASAPAGLAASSAAVASAALTTSSASAIGIVHLMTQAKLISGLVGVGLFVATLSTTIQQFNRARSADTVLMSARETNSALSAEKKTVEEHLALAQREKDRLVKQHQDAESSGTNAAHRAAGAAKGATWDPVAEGKAFMERHPAVRQALINHENAQTNYQWSAFYELAGLSQSEISDFQTLMRQMTRFGRSRIQGMQDLEFKLGSGLTPEEWHGQFRALLGEERFRQFNEFSRSFSARELAAQAAGALAFTPTPLAAEQFTGLAQRITENKAIQHTKTGPKIDWDIVTADARGVLTPAQLTILDGLRAQSEFNEEYSRVAAANRSQSQTKPASVATP